jgi:hypothetical protein
MGKPRSVIAKTMITTKNIKTVFDFFIDIKNLESGGALKNIQRDKDDWWVCDSPFGKARMRLRHNEKFGILDHDFVGGGVEWTVSCRVTPNEEGSTVTWLFIRPEPMTQEQFESQLKNFDVEINGWKKALES